MSYFDDASLVMIPSGYKDQKVYSVKPIDGSGDLTFSRASNASRINSSGLVEKVRENLITYSEDLSNAAYTNDPTDGSITITANYGVAPNGTNTADRVQITKGTSYSQIYQAKSVTAGVEYSFSLYLKSLSGTPTITILYNENGAVGKATLTSSWVRYTFTYNAPLTSTNYPMIALYGGDSASCDILAWGLQFETGVPTDYIATTSSAVSVGATSGTPRLDYSGGASCPSLLLEPQRTNAVTFSESFDNAAWTKVAGTITANNAVSPDGYQNADLFTADGTTTQHAVLQSQTAGAKTISFFVKMGTQRYVQILTSGTVDAVANYDLQTGSVGGLGSASTASMVDYGNGWWRLILTSTDVLTGGIYLCFANSLTDGRYPAVSSSGTVWIWGAMSELGATYASSYLNTLSTAVTRVADAASKTGISSLIGQTEGTIFVEFQTLQLNPTNVSRIILSDGTTSNYIFLGLNEAGSGNLSRLYVNNTGAGTSVSVFSSTALTVGTNKLAMAYKSGSFALYLNGNLVGSSSSAVTIPATSQLVIGGQSPSAINQLETMVDKQIILFKTRLSNADLATLTA